MNRTSEEGQGQAPASVSGAADGQKKERKKLDSTFNKKTQPVLPKLNLMIPANRMPNTTDSILTLKPKTIELTASATKSLDQSLVKIPTVRPRQQFTVQDFLNWIVNPVAVTGKFPAQLDDVGIDLLKIMNKLFSDHFENLPYKVGSCLFFFSLI